MNGRVELRFVSDLVFFAKCGDFLCEFCRVFFEGVLLGSDVAELGCLFVDFLLDFFEVFFKLYFSVGKPCKFVLGGGDACFVCCKIDAECFDFFLKCYLFDFSFLFDGCVYFCYFVLQGVNGGSYVFDVVLVLLKCVPVFLHCLVKFIKGFFLSVENMVEAACFVCANKVCEFLVCKCLVAVFFQLF